MAFNSVITPDPCSLERYRRHISSPDLSIEQIDTLINVVSAILLDFVDQAFTDQLGQTTLEASSNKLTVLRDKTMIENHSDTVTGNTQDYGVESDSSLLGPTEP